MKAGRTGRLAGFALALALSVFLYLAREDLIPQPPSDDGPWKNLALVLTPVLIIFAPVFFCLIVVSRPLPRWIFLVLTCLTSLYCWLVLQWPGPEVAERSLMGERPSLGHQYLRLGLVGALLAGPPLCYGLYCRSSLASRHVCRQFFFPFLFTLAALFSLWLVFDLSDNLPDFRKGDIGLLRVASFYLFQVPLVFTQIAQPAFLIALVYGLSRMARANEILVLLGSGRSLGHIVLPLFVCGLAVTLVFTAFNYEWAPWAEGHKESLLKQFKRGEKQSTIAERQLYVNASDRRSWYIGQIPFELASDPLQLVDVYQRSDDNHLTRSIMADAAKWRRQDRVWTFYRCSVADYDSEGALVGKRFHERYLAPGWVETPWLLVSGKLEPDYLGVPQLRAYLETHGTREAARPALYQTNLHYRWAAPWSCLAMFFVAAPLGIAHSRRGALGGIAAAILLFAGVLFLTELSLALGKSGHLRPAIAAWMSNLVFTGFGGLIFWMKAQNHSFSLRHFFSR